MLAVTGLAARSYMLTRLAFFVWPMVMVLVAIRGGVMGEFGRQGGPVTMTGARAYTTSYTTTAHISCSPSSVFQLNKNQAKFRWECANDYALWPASATAEYAISGASMPKLVCEYGFHSFYTGVAVSLVLDLMFQIYGWFLVWRYKASLEHAYRLLQTGKALY